MNESGLRIVATLGCDVDDVARFATHEMLQSIHLLASSTLDAMFAEPGHPDVVIIGPGVHDQIEIAQRLHLQHPAATAIILSAPDELNATRERLRFAPRISLTTVCLANDDTDGVALRMSRASHGAISRRSNKLDVSAALTAVPERQRPPELDAPIGLQQLLESLPLGVAALDDGGRVIMWNGELPTLLGEDRDLVGLPFVSLLPQERRGEVTTRLHSLGRRPQLKSRTMIQIAHPDEDVLHLELTFSSLTTTTGERFAIVSLRDTTIERNAAETERHATTLSNRTLQLQNQLIFSVAKTESHAEDLDVALADAIRAICNASGWPYGEAWTMDASTRAFRFAHRWSEEDAYAPFTEAGRVETITQDSGILGEAIRSGQPQWIADLSSNRDLDRADLAASVGLRSAIVVPIIVDEETAALLLFFLAEPREEDPGLIRAVQALGRPMGIAAARHQAEGALRSSEERYRVLIDAIADHAIFTLNQDANIVTWNAGAERITGLAAGEVLGNSLAVLLPAQSGARIATLIQTAIREGHASEEGWLIRPSGPFWAEHSVNCLRNGDGTPSGFACVIRDLTERHQYELNLEKRTKDLARSNADLERFAYVAAHDLQEPLRSVAGFSQLLHHRYVDQLDDTGMEYLEFIKTGAERMNALVQDLLSFSRLGAAAAKPTRISMAVVCDEALEILREAITDSAATITVGELPHVLADRSQVTQVLQNLIANALKYTEGVPPQVNITANRAGAEWAFAIRDNGVGIAPEYHDQIFEAFQRLSRTTQGSGIGLATCRRVVEAHGGRIWTESAPGDGSTFFFTLPAAD